MDKNVILRGRNDYTVRCQDCGWEYNGINGVGLAAQHCDRHGHTVHVDSYGSITFTQEESDYYKDWEAQQKTS